MPTTARISDLMTPLRDAHRSSIDAFIKTDLSQYKAAEGVFEASLRDLEAEMVLLEAQVALDNPSTVLQEAFGT